MRDFTKFWTIFNAIEGFSTKPQIYGNCGGDYAGIYGTIASPGFPLANYPKNSACKWTVEVPKGMIVEVDMEWMDLEPDPSGCNFDFLAFYDSGVNRTKENTFCGTKPIFPIISETSHFTVEFASDGNEEKTGFALRWMAVEPPKEIFNCDFEKGQCLGWGFEAVGISAEEENFYAVAKLDPPSSNNSQLSTSTSNTFSLVSPTVWPTATDNCFTLKVRPGSLDSLQVADSNGIELYQKKIDAKLDRANSLGSWSRVVVSLPRVVEPLHIRIKGEHRGDNPVPAALDDFNLEFQPCEVLREDKPPCGLGLYRCQSGKNCIPTDYICDGVQDCFHGDDELNCQESGNSSISPLAAGPTTPTTSAPPPTTTFTESQENYCDKNEYSCQGRAGCIPISWLCDGTKECAFGDDEENCPEKKVKFMESIIIEADEETTTTATTTTVTTSSSTSTTLETSQTTTEKMKPENNPEIQELPEFFDDFVNYESNTTNEIILKSHKNSTEEEIEIIQLVRVAPPKPDSVKGTLPSLILLLLAALSLLC